MGMTNPSAAEQAIRLLVEYQYVSNTVKNNSEAYSILRKEVVILNRNSSSAKFQIETPDAYTTVTYQFSKFTEYLFELIDRIDFQPKNYLPCQESLQDSSCHRLYRLSVEFNNHHRSVISGHFNALELPAGFPELAQALQIIKSYCETSELLNPELYNALPQCASDLCICTVKLVGCCCLPCRYQCTIPSIAKGNMVVVSGSGNNKIQIGVVQNIIYYQYPYHSVPQDLPCIIRECTQQDLFSCAAWSSYGSSPEEAFFKIEPYFCPLVGHPIYFEGRGGCRELCDLSYPDGNKQLLQQFHIPYSAEKTMEICNSCPRWK